MRKLVIILVLLAVIAGAAIGGRKAYRHWKSERAITQARATLAKGEIDATLLWLRQALSANGNHVEAIRMMGDFAEQVGSPTAVAWRRRLLDVEPGPVTNRFMLARAAVAQKDYLTAMKALAEVDGPNQRAAEYHRLFAAVALGTSSFQTAQVHFEEVLKLEPGNPVPAVQLGMLLIQRPEPASAARGLNMLEGLRTNPVVRLEALRHLSFDAFRHTNHARALKLADELVQHPDATQADQVLHLNLLVATQSPSLETALARYREQARTNAQHAFQIGRWMLGSQGSARALAWLQSLPPAVSTNFPVSMVMADAQLGLTNWAGLQRVVQDKRWGEMDYLRLMYFARALREQDFAAAAKSEWSKVVQEIAGRLERLEAVQVISANWGWNQETEEVLWLIVNRFPGQKRYFATLADRLFAQGKSRSLLTLYTMRAKLEPNDFTVKNNLAALALLLNSDQHQPHALAKAVYEHQNDNPFFAATYAYSLHLQKKNAESLAVMRGLKPEDRERPAIAGYYGLILAASGDKSGAKKYLDIARNGKMLPEEEELFQRARL